MGNYILPFGRRILTLPQGFNKVNEKRKLGTFGEKAAVCKVFLERQSMAFGLAEKLWEEVPNLLIIYVAHSTEDVFAALGMPFFHIVRSYDLEQDLKAAFCKLGRLKISLSEKVRFTWNGRMLLVPRKDILYLESEHHDIYLHVVKQPAINSDGKEYFIKNSEVITITETLSQCEGKLKGMGFARNDFSATFFKTE